MNVSSALGSVAKPKQMRAMAIAIGVALSAALLGASSAAASSAQRVSTPVPACPPAAVVTATLHQAISKSTSTTSHATGFSRICVYMTKHGLIPSPITIRLGSPVSAAQFNLSVNAAKHGVVMVAVHGLGNEAWAVQRGNGLFVLKGTLMVVISAGATSDAQLEALAHKII
jgi:hypothetical protein